MPFQFKKDPFLLCFAAVLAGGVFALVWHGDVKWETAAAFMSGALAMPGLFGRKDPTP